MTNPNLEDSKFCNLCCSFLFVSDFYKSSRTSDGLQRICKHCERIKAAYWRKKYPEHAKNKSRRSGWKRNGIIITTAEYEALFEKQNGKCAVCQKHVTELSRRLDADHHHLTGKIRGLLCLPCNRTVVYAVEFYDNLIDKARSYVKNGN